MAANVQQASKLEKLQFQLEGFIENLRTVGVIAGDFQQNGQTNFNDKL
jgi:mediator of RNA polymerase II transcription subunit 10